MQKPESALPSTSGDWRLYPALSLAIAGLGGAYIYFHHSTPIAAAPVKPYQSPAWVDTAYVIVMGAYLFAIVFGSLLAIRTSRKMLERQNREFDEAYEVFDLAGKFLLKHPDDLLARHNYEVLHKVMLDIIARQREEAGL